MSAAGKHTPETSKPDVLVAESDDVLRLVRDLQRDGFEVTEQDICDILETLSGRRERDERLRRQLADAVIEIQAPVPIVVTGRRGGGKRGQRGAARARRGWW